MNYCPGDGEDRESASTRGPVQPLFRSYGDATSRPAHSGSRRSRRDQPIASASSQTPAEKPLRARNRGWGSLKNPHGALLARPPWLRVARYASRRRTGHSRNGVSATCERLRADSPPNRRSPSVPGRLTRTVASSTMRCPGAGTGHVRAPPRRVTSRAACRRWTRAATRRERRGAARRARLRRGR